MNKHDVKVGYTYLECTACCSGKFRKPCDGYDYECDYYKGDGTESCKGAKCIANVFEITQTTKLIYANYGINPYNYDLDEDIELKIGNKDYSKFIITYLKVDGKVLYKESEDDEKP